VIDFQQETFLDFWKSIELPSLLAEHSEMFAGNGLEFGIDPETYSRIDSLGALQIVTARRDGELVGYCLLTIQKHNHFRDLLVGFEDSYFVTSKLGFVRGKVLLDMILFSLLLAKARGVQRVYFTSDDLVPTERLLEFAGLYRVWTVFEADLEGLSGG